MKRTPLKRGKPLTRTTGLRRRIPASDTETGRHRVSGPPPAQEIGALMPDVPYGYCHCGCGEKTKLASQTRTAHGHVKGEPLRFIVGHVTRLPENRHRAAEAAHAKSGAPSDVLRDDQGRSCVERTCRICEEPFLVLWCDRSHPWRKTCSKECAAKLVRKEGAASKARRGKGNPNYKGGHRVGVRDRAGEERWYAAMEQTCQHPACPGTERILALHHVCYVQHVTKAGGDKWDPANSLTLCFACHSSHHRKGRYTVPLTALRDKNYTFAFELMGPAAYDYLRRYYGGEDPRLDALLDRVYGTTTEEAA